jgi:hypothetical protein
MAKRLLRRIVVDGEAYLWYRKHWHLKEYSQSPCVETLTVFIQNSKNVYLRIHFKEDDFRHRSDLPTYWHVSYSNSGTISLVQSERSTHFNLNHPRVVAALIRLLRRTHWPPSEAKPSLTIVNGLHFLDEYAETLLTMIAPSDMQDRVSCGA